MQLQILLAIAEEAEQTEDGQVLTMPSGKIILIPNLHKRGGDGMEATSITIEDAQKF